MLTYPTIDPVAISLGGFAVHWYGLSYIVGILLAWRYALRLSQKRGYVAAGGGHDAMRMALDDLVWRAALGMMIGGRLAYILLYNLPAYLEQPKEILAIAHGGMSFHGGLVGVILAMIWQARISKTGFWPLADVVAAGTPIGLFLGRIANFVNGELYGRIADPAVVPWAMVFPRAADGLPRHPSQIYQAGLEGVVLFVLLALLAWRTSALKKPGIVAGTFLMSYGLFRFVLEFFREPDPQLGLFLGSISMGQLLSALMVGAGLTLLDWAYKGRLAPRPDFSPKNDPA
jgi:phosphatidylglycerol:prolipoprotein diacylglycerol transferase